MKLMRKLKNEAKIETPEQAKRVIANPGMELNDEELDQVSGGNFQPPGGGGGLPERHDDFCIICGERYSWYDPNPKPTSCPFCDNPITEGPQDPDFGGFTPRSVS